MWTTNRPAPWGPSHQRTGTRGRAAVGVIALYLALTFEAFLGALIVVGIVVVAARCWSWLRRRDQARADRVLRGGADPLDGLRERALASGGMYLGVDADTMMRFSRGQRAVLLLGPPRSGKTSGVIVPALIAHPGPAVSTSTKPDVATRTAVARARTGRLWVFDPAGAGAPARFERLRWSPVACSRGWDGALLMARAMTAGARAGAEVTHGSHWVSRSQALLAPLLHAAALDGREMETVVDWVMRHELDEPGVLLEHDLASRLAFGSLLGIFNTEPRERASIFSAAADALQAYTSEAALEAAKDPNFDASTFVASSDTVYIVAPAEDQAAAAPLVCGLLAEIRRATYLAHSNGTARSRVLFCLDEAANIAPLDELPQIASEGGGQGVLLLAAFQDLSQARLRWGPAADGFLTLFGTKLLLPGIADQTTLEAISVALGEYDRQTIASTRKRGESPLGGSTTVATQRTRVLSPGEVANIPAGRALHLDGLTWELLTLTPAHAVEPFKTFTAPVAGTGR